jgi:polyether ionophore transport system permease protein
VAGARAVAPRALADSRFRTISFALLFAFSALLQATAYREAYPTLEDRVEFARSVELNDAVRLLYGEPLDLLSVGGYVGWRVGGSLVIFAALWGLLGAVRAMRAEEDAGRAELVLAGAVSRRTAFLAQLAAIGVGAALLWLATFVALVAAGLPAGGSAFLALAVISPVPVFVGVGALASQLAPAKRLATGLSTVVLAIAFTLRAVADTAPGLGWLRWATPLGWAEEMRPFVDPRPIVLILPVIVGALLLVLAGALAVRRDIGNGLLPRRDSSPPSSRLLGSPTAQALRSERGILVAWLLGIGAFAFLMGVLSDIATSDVLSDDVRDQLEKLGLESVATPAGFLGFIFLVVILLVSLFCCMQLASTRGEESEQRLETLLALPVGRRGWIAGRMLVAAAGAAAVALAAGALAWAGAATQGARVSLSDMLGAGANSLPPALLFLAVGVLAFAIVPRAGTGIAYGLVGGAFVLEVFGSLLELPEWLLALSPFHDIGLVPGEPFEATGALVMLALAAASALAALWLFARRDVMAA